MAGDGAGSDDAGLVHVWRRWTGERDVSLAGYCRLWDGPPPLPPFGRARPEGREPPLEYVPPVARWALRHTPLLVLAVVVFDVLIRADWTVLRGVDQLVQAVTTPTVAGIALLFLAWLVLLVVLVRLVVITPDRTAALQAVIVYGLAIGLSAGLVIGIYAALPGARLPVDAGVEAAVLDFPWHFHWMLFFGGMLVYDGMLRTENMFTRLHEKEPAVIDAPDAYRATFVEQLQRQLDHSIGVPAWMRARIPGLPVPEVPTAYVFSIIFVAPFYLFWTLEPLRGTAPPLWIRAVRNLVPAVLDFFLVVVFFQFLVLIAFFNHLLTVHGIEPDRKAAFGLQYSPGHPDDFAGFRDLGRFATRVNVILVVGGVYLAYQLSLHGWATYPGYDTGVTITLVSWAVTNLLPLVVYVLAVVFWLYLSFWQLHRSMRRGRVRAVERRARTAGDIDPELREGPVWPIDNRLLVTVLSMDLLPVVTLLPFIPS